MNAGGGEADHRVACRDILCRQQRAALGCTHCKTREIVIAILIKPRHLRRLAADQRATGFATAFRNAGDDRSGGFGVELAAGKVVEKKQRLRTLDHEIVDRHRHEVDADAAM